MKQSSSEQFEENYCTTKYYLREGGEEATSGSRRDLGSVDGGDHECIANADSGDEPTNHEETIVGGESHEDSPGKEYNLGYHDGVSPAYPVGSSAGGARADEWKEVENPGEDFNLSVWDFEVFFDVDYSSTHYTNI